MLADGDGVVLILHVQPRAKKSRIVGTYGEALKVQLAAPPVDGRANEALRRFFATALGVSRRDVEILSGQTGRHKRLRVRGLTPEAAIAALGL
ncbi:MAG: YggU family protein [Deltaproteobacteria bacterium]|nr:MAG: YggU family protein [Deltaproteobacteria bacterium]